MDTVNQELIKSILNAWNFNGAISVIKGNTSVFMTTVGMANFEKRYPFTEHTTMELASLSKQFTAVAVMKMFESGMY